MPWLPEILFEIVGQGPRRAKTSYQLLVTRFQASANRGFLPTNSPPPGGARKVSRARPRERPVVSRKRRVPAASREISPRHLGSPVRPGRRPRRPLSPTLAPLVPGKPSWPPHNAARSLPATRRSLPVEFPPREKKTSRPRLAAASVKSGKEGKKRLS